MKKYFLDGFIVAGLFCASLYNPKGVQLDKRHTLHIGNIVQAPVKQNKNSLQKIQRHNDTSRPYASVSNKRNLLIEQERAGLYPD